MTARKRCDLPLLGLTIAILVASFALFGWVGPTVFGLVGGSVWAESVHPSVPLADRVRGVVANVTRNAD
jgi:hypothetical protein